MLLVKKTYFGKDLKPDEVAERLTLRNLLPVSQNYKTKATSPRTAVAAATRGIHGY